MIYSMFLFQVAEMVFDNDHKYATALVDFSI